jgi:L-amino acid N-acyltransferase YncA
MASAAAGFLPLLPEGQAIPNFDPRRYEEVIRTSGVRMLLAEEAGELLGYTAFGTSRDLDVAPDVGEVRAFFVAPAAWRRGVGSALMAEALASLSESGYTEATVWSFDANARANAFYEHHGFRRNGAEKRQELWAGVLEVRYRRPLP